MSPPERTFGPIGWKGLFGDDDESSDEESTGEEGSAGADRRDSSVEEGPAGVERRGADADRGATRRSGSGEAIRDERARRASELSAEDEGSDEDADPLDDWKTLEEMSREDRSERRDEPSESARERETPVATARTGEDQDGPSTTEDDAERVAPEGAGPPSGVADDAGDGAEGAASEEDEGIRDRIDAFYARYFLPPSVTDDDFGDEEPADVDAGTGSEAEATTGTGSTAGSEATSGTGRTGGSGRTVDTDRTAGREAESSSRSGDAAGAAAGAGAASSTGRDTTGTTDRTRQGVRDRRAAGNAEPPPSEPRVRTAESGPVSGDEETGDPEATAGDPEATADDSEVTFGPIGLKGISGSEADATEETATAREATPRRETGSSTEATMESTRPPETARTRTIPGGETATDDEALTSRVPWSISVTAIAVGVGLLVFIDIVSMMVPLIAAIGAGIVGGFVAGYISGGTVRGGMHALAVGIIGGISVGYLTALVGALIGLFLEPATLLGRLVGPITPDLGMFGSWGPLLVMVLVTAMVAIDATLAGVVGGTLRSMVDEVR